METLPQISIVTALIAAAFAFWSASNVERLKLRSAKKMHDLTSSFQKDIEFLRLELDRSRKAYDIHVAKIYELYESVFPKLVDAYYSMVAFRALDSDVFLDAMLTQEEIESRRSENLDKSDKLLGFINDVERKKAFIPPEIYSEIEKFWRMGVNTGFVRQFPSLFRPPFQQDLRESSDEELREQLEVVAAQIRRSLFIANA